MTTDKRAEFFICNCSRFSWEFIRTNPAIAQRPRRYRQFYYILFHHLIMSYSADHRTKVSLLVPLAVSFTLR